jgi:hypothetical protein
MFTIRTKKHHDEFMGMFSHGFDAFSKAEGYENMYKDSPSVLESVNEMTFQIHRQSTGGCTNHENIRISPKISLEP